MHIHATKWLRKIGGSRVRVMRLVLATQALNI
jgi:hypothetical protein